MRVSVRYIIALLSIAFLMSASLSAQSSQRILAGRVVDSHKEPLAGANVYVRGLLRNGTSTDVEGYFSLKLPDDRKIFIEASFIGMKPYSVAYNGQKEILIVMEDDMNMMEGAVVMGKQNINDLDIRAKAGVINMVDITRLQDKPIADLSL